MLTLDIAIATHRPEGIIRLANGNLPRISGVRYVVSWQSHFNTPIPEKLNRPDVAIYRFNHGGQSRNRNNALSLCSADIVLISDDDVAYNAAGIMGIMKAFEQNPDVEVATFKSEHGDMSRFPDTETDLTKNWPRGYVAAGIEIAIRLNKCRKLRFCPELGLGSPKLHGEEDEAFVLSAIKHGQNCRFFPITICSHPHESTGTKRNATEFNLQANGCFIALRWPLTAILRLPLKAWRINRDKKISMLKALKHLIKGALMAPGVLKRNHDSLW